MPVAASTFDSTAAFNPGSLARLSTHSSNEIWASSPPSVDASSSKGTKGLPSAGLFRGKRFSKRFSSLVSIEPLPSTSIWLKTMMPGVAAASAALMASSASPAALFSS